MLEAHNRVAIGPKPPVCTVDRRDDHSADEQAGVAFRGGHLRLPAVPFYELVDGRTAVIVHCRLGADCLDIATTAGTVIARHTLAPAGAGVMVRDHGHVLALDQAAMTAASPAAPHRRKQRIPPGPAARAAAQTLRTAAGATAQPTASDGVIDLARYAAAARGRNTLSR